MLNSVLDASALLALLFKESGHEQVTEALAAGSGASTVNLSEIVARCVRIGMPNDVVSRLIGALPVTWIEHDVELAYRAGEMSAVTQPSGLSLGDRCCLALAMRENVPAVTADRAWLSIGSELGVVVTLIR